MFISIYIISLIPISLIIWFLTKTKMQIKLKEIESKFQIKQEQLEKLQIDLNNISEINFKINNDKISLESKNEYLKQRLDEQKEELKDIQEKMKIEFKNIANSILEEKTQKFTDQNKVNIETILKPLKENLLEYQKQIEQTNKESIERTAILKTEIKKINESSLQLSKEAEGLTRALKGDTKVQGNWGEFILESILEKSGLIRDREYFVQQSFRNEESKLYRPDIIIKLPDEKHIIIDSKVSLSHYVEYINLDDSQGKDLYLQKHLISVKNHILELSKKQYETLYELNTLDFVLMFMPIQSSFTLASEKDPMLFNKALEKNIVIVCPSTLMATLKTIKHTWKTEYQTRNVQEIARQGGALYDKFVSFTEDLIKVGNRIEDTLSIYKSAAKKLYEGKDNLVRKTQKLKELGANTKKTINPSLLEKTYPLE